MIRRLLALFLLTLTPAAWAGPITLMEVDAHSEAGKTDPAAEVVARQLRSRGFGHFTVESRKDTTLAPGDAASIRLRDGHVMRVRLIEEQADSAKLRVKLLRDGEVQVSSVMTLSETRPLILRAGASGGAEILGVVTVD